MGLGTKTPSYTPPPAVPPAAQPATLASSSVAQAAGNRATEIGFSGMDIGTAGGAEGVAPSSVTSAKQTLGGVT